MKKIKIPQDELITFKQTSELLKVHPNTLRLWDKNGILQAIRFGKRGDRRYKKTDVLQLIQKTYPQTVTSNASVIDFFKSDFERTIERLGRFQHLINELSNAHTGVEVADIIIRQGMEALHAQSGLIALLDEDEKMLEIFHAVGFKKRQLKSWSHLPISAPIHLADSVRTGNVIFIEDIHEGKIRYPLTAKIAQASDNVAFTAAPLTVNKKIIGVLCLSFSEKRTFSEADRLFIQALGKQCAQSLERVKAEEAMREGESRYRLIVEGLQDYAIFTLNSLGIITSWNTGAEKLLRFKDNQIIGKHFSLLFTAADRQKKLPEKELQQVRRIGRAEDDNWIQRRDGSIFWASGNTQVIKNDKQEQEYIKIIRDRSLEKKIEREKDQFVSLISHELKNPLTSLYIFSTLLRDKVKKDEKALKYISRIEEQSQKISHLINNLLEESSVRAKGFTFNDKPFSIDKLIQHSVEIIGSNKKTHEIIIKGKTKKTITADPERIGQVLENFLTNAIKYSPKAKKIVVTVKADKKNITFSVQDFGIGISKENIKKIFTPFFRATDSQQEIFPSIGLGLFIAVEIVKHYKGKIWVESEEGKGSTFYFTLPIKNSSIFMK